MPGHTSTRRSPSYAKLTCDGVAPAPYTGIEVGFSSLCIGKEVDLPRSSTTSSREVAALTPGPYLHIGGDEAHATDPDEYAHVRRARPGDRPRARQADGRLGGDRASRACAARPSSQHWHDPALARRAVAQGAKARSCRRRPKAYLDMKYAPDRRSA